MKRNAKLKKTIKRKKCPLKKRVKKIKKKLKMKSCVDKKLNYCIGKLETTIKILRASKNQR